LQTLATVGWLSEQPPDFQDRIAAAGRWTTFGRGQMLYPEGDEADAVFGRGKGLCDIPIPINRDDDAVISRAPAFDGTSGDWACAARLLHRNVTLALHALSEVLALPPRAPFARMLQRIASPEGLVQVTQAEPSKRVAMSRAAFSGRLAT